MFVIALMELDVAVLITCEFVVLEKLNVRVCCVFTVSRRLGELEQRWCSNKRESENMKSASTAVYKVYLEFEMHLCIYLPENKFDFKLSDTAVRIGKHLLSAE
jgi:hypothetical protein